MIIAQTMGANVVSFGSAHKTEAVHCRIYSGSFETAAGDDIGSLILHPCPSLEILLLLQA